MDNEYIRVYIYMHIHIKHEFLLNIGQDNQLIHGKKVQ